MLGVLSLRVDQVEFCCSSYRIAHAPPDRQRSRVALCRPSSRCCAVVS